MISFPGFRVFCASPELTEQDVQQAREYFASVTGLERTEVTKLLATAKNKELRAIVSCADEERRKTDITVKFLLFVSGTKTANSTLHFEPQFNVYEFMPATGWSVLYLLTKPLVFVPLGHNSLYLEPANPADVFRPERHLLEKMAAAQSIPTMEGKTQLSDTQVWSALIEKHGREPVFFRLALPLTDEEIVELKKLSFDELEENFQKFLCGSVELDPVIFYLFRGFSLPNPPVLPPEMAKYNPHAVIVTNPSTGKTTNASKLGRVYNRASPACLLGFSTADSANEGALNGACGPIFFDDLQDEKNETSKNGLLSFEEQGRADTALGKAVICTRGTAPLVYFANTNPIRKSLDGTLTNFMGTTPADLCFSLEGQLSKATNNPRAFGRRKGFFLFGNEFKPARGAPDPDAGDMPEKIEGCLRDLAGPELLRIFSNREILTWLERPFSGEYINQIHRFASSVISGSLSEFFLGLTEAHRHARGLALRHAIRDNLPAVLNGMWMVSELIESGEQHLQTIQNYNLKSISRVVEVEPKVTEEFYVQQVKNFRPEYGRHLLYTLIYLTGKFRDEELKEALPLEIVAANHGLAQEAAGCSDAYFAAWHRLAGKLNASALRSALQGVGVDIWKVGDAILIKILEVERLRLVGSVLFQKKSTPTQKEGADGAIGAKTPQTPQTPQVNEWGQAEKDLKSDQQPRTDTPFYGMVEDWREKIRLFLEKQPGRQATEDTIIFELKAQGLTLPTEKIEDILRRFKKRGVLYERLPGVLALV